MSLFCVDVGNSNVVMGLYEGEQLATHWRIATDPHKMADEYAMLTLDLFERSGQDPEAVEGVIVASVVPPLTSVFSKLSERYFHQTPLVFDATVHTSVRILLDNPMEVGADRVANVVAAFHRYGGPACVVDLGTGTTFDRPRATTWGVRSRPVSASPPKRCFSGPPSCLASTWCARLPPSAETRYTPCSRGCCLATWDWWRGWWPVSAPSWGRS
jgi:hypothetical protein